MKAEEILKYLALLDKAEDYKPLMKKLVKVVKSYSYELKDLVDPFYDYLRKARVKSVNFYTEEGFSKSDAILMSMHDSVSLDKMMDKFNEKKGK